MRPMERGRRNEKHFSARAKMSSSPIVEMTGAISRRTRKKSPVIPPLTLQLGRGRREICVGVGVILSSVPFPSPGAATSEHVAKPISRQKAQRDTSIFASSTPKKARLSSAQRRDRSGHGGIASWHADSKQICRGPYFSPPPIVQS